MNCRELDRRANGTRRNKSCLFVYCDFLLNYRIIAHHGDWMQLFRASAAMLHQQNHCAMPSTCLSSFSARFLVHENLYSPVERFSEETLRSRSCEFARSTCDSRTTVYRHGRASFAFTFSRETSRICSHQHFVLVSETRLKLFDMLCNISHVCFEQLVTPIWRYCSLREKNEYKLNDASIFIYRQLPDNWPRHL